MTGAAAPGAQVMRAEPLTFVKTVQIEPSWPKHAQTEPIRPVVAVDHLLPVAAVDLRQTVQIEPSRPKRPDRANLPRRRCRPPAAGRLPPTRLRRRRRASPRLYGRGRAPPTQPWP